MPETIMDQIGADGAFTDGFSGAIKTALGGEYAESKYFDDIPDVTALAKRGIDTKVKNTELSEQLKNAIARPGEMASDDDKAAFNRGLQVELGAGKTAEEYMFGKPENLPEGLPYNEESAKVWAEFFNSKAVPVETARDIVKAVWDQAIAGHNAKMQAEKAKFDTAVTEIRGKNQPEELKVMGRQVVDFVNAYGSADTPVKDASGQEVPSQKIKGLQSLVKEANLYETPDDFEKWLTVGIDPSQWTLMSRIGKDMQAGSQRAGAGGAGGATSEAKSQAALQNAVCAQTPEQQVAVPV